MTSLTTLAARIGAVAIPLTMAGALVSALPDPGAYGATPTSSTSDRHIVPGPTSPCVTEDQLDSPCVWDGRHMGNGVGRSFLVTRDGRRVFVSHRRAHMLYMIGTDVPSAG